MKTLISISIVSARMHNLLVFICTLLFLTIPASGQILSIDGFCHTDSVETPTDPPDELYRGGMDMGECYPDAPGPYYMRVYAHAVRKDDCVDGQTLEKIK